MVHAAPGTAGNARPPGRTTLGIVFTTILIDFIGFSVLFPVLPLFADRLGATPFQVGLIVTIYALAQLLFAESTAIGVRSVEADRIVLPRELRRVTTAHGRIGVKVVRCSDGRLEFSAEYDDCKRAARRSGAPLREVIRCAEEAARNQLS